MNIQLSIVMPTMNRPQLLQEAVSSVFLPGVGVKVEVIIADDGSTDDTAVVCQDMIKRFGPDHVMISRTEQNLGAQVARNRGLQAARGGLVQFVDSDDVMAMEGVAKLVACLHANPSLDYAFGKVIQTDAQLKPLPGDSSVGAPFSNAPVEVAGYHWHTMGAIYRKSYLHQVGFWNEALTGSQDWEYQARAKLAGGRGLFVDTVVGYWRHHGGSRVGAKAFRPDYVRSVMLACDSILKKACQAGQCDRQLRRRLAKKLMVHALEWGANGYAKERRECLAQAASSVSNDWVFKTLVWSGQFSPLALDLRIWRALTGQPKNLAGGKGG
jgi:glycosyltransferase involved in cell wall biosynthesis